MRANPKKWGMAAGLVAILAAVGWLLRPDPILVDVAEVGWGPLRIVVREDGLTRIRERYEISTPLAGRLVRIGLDVGDPVRADETVVARMEPTLPSMLDPRAVAQAQSRVRAAERRAEVARVQLQTARAEADHAEAERIRIYQLRQKDAASDIELTQAELQARRMGDARRAAEYTVEIAEYELELEKAALLLTRDDGQKSDDGTELRIPAPIDGRVLRIHQENSAVIPAGTVLLEVGDPSDLEIVVDVLSQDAVRIRPGAEVMITRWGGDRPLPGRVRYVEPAGFTKVSALGVEEQRVNVVIDLMAPPGQRESLGDSFRVEAEITVWNAESVLRIPTAALFRQGDDWAAFVVEGGVARPTPVRIGRMNETWAEALEGVSPGAIVIEYPGDRVAEGVRVRPRP